jgi:hypothetical protein
LLPFPDINKKQESDIEDNITNILNIKFKWYSLDETVLDYTSFIKKFNKMSLKEGINCFISEYEKDILEYKYRVHENDKTWLGITLLDNSIVNKNNENRPSEELLDMFKQFRSEEKRFVIINEILQNSVGLAFKRFSKEDRNPIKTLNNENIFSIDTSKVFHNIESPDFLFHSELLNNAINKVKDFIIDKDIDIEFEKGLGIESIDRYFSDTKLFFEYHFSRYSPNRREAPIYWPIATKSNSFVIWIYYPAINENTLFKIVNELVEPKLEDVKKQVAALEMSSASKELHEQMALQDELIDFKEELLRVAQLPYKPNQDDGVLITAAPLHNLFRHTKWRKSTEACWKKLEKGEYDWAHLAYSIWPDRVTNKCKKDLSMAIAHGLESICEIKPKKKKTRKKPEIKVKTQKKLI